MTEPRRALTDQEAERVAADLIMEHAWLKKENRRLRAALEELSQYSGDCDHDMRARRALMPDKP
jgi:hypothetical protein